MTYLGDWHSHPNSLRPYLSPKDRRALRKIAISEEAQVLRPLSLVCAGTPENWEEGVWVGEMAKFFWNISYLAVAPGSLVAYLDPNDRR